MPNGRLAQAEPQGLEPTWSQRTQSQSLAPPFAVPCARAIGSFLDARPSLLDRGGGEAKQAKAEPGVLVGPVRELPLQGIPTASTLDEKSTSVIT